MHARQAAGDFIFLSCSSLLLSQFLSVSLCIVFPPSLPNLQSTPRSHSPPHRYHPPPLPPTTPKPLAVINPSIVTVTAEHASYACLSRVEELITTSQKGPYRGPYMWCACDTISEIHADAPCHELHCWILPEMFPLCYVTLTLLLAKPIFYYIRLSI